MGMMIYDEFRKVLITKWNINGSIKLETISCVKAFVNFGRIYPNQNTCEKFYENNCKLLGHVLPNNSLVLVHRFAFSSVASSSQFGM